MIKTVFYIIRIVLAILSMIVFGFMVIPMFGRMINIGNISGAFLCIWIFCMSVKPIHNKIKSKMTKNIFSKILYRVINICFILFALYGTVVTSLMFFCMAQSPAENSTAIVLGAQVKPWGPSIILQGRIDAAEKYLANNPNANAVLSGGQGNDEHISEAQCMYDEIVSDGFSAKRLYMEDKSTSTIENLEYSMKIINDNNLNGDIAIVTDGFHQLRARIIAYKMGIKENVGSVNADTSLVYMPTYIVREWFGIPYEIFLR